MADFRETEVAKSPFRIIFTKKMYKNGVQKLLINFYKVLIYLFNQIIFKISSVKSMTLLKKPFRLSTILKYVK